MNASVTIMRSYDYCHFEVQLSQECLNDDEVNVLRIWAALLVDEAVRQYILAKQAETNRQSRAWQTEKFLNDVKRIKETPESEWSVQDAALMKTAAEKEFWDDLEKDDYYYQDDPERDEHFSMLNKFHKVNVKV